MLQVVVKKKKQFNLQGMPVGDDGCKRARAQSVVFVLAEFALELRN